MTRVFGRPFPKGASGNPGGMSREQRDLRAALKNEGEEIHRALMNLVRRGNPFAIVYAHRQLVGEPRQRMDVVDGSARPLAEISTTVLLAYLENRGCLGDGQAQK